MIYSIHALCREIIGEPFAIIYSILFISGASFYSVANNLMLAHYLLGLILITWSIKFALKSNSALDKYTLASSALYFLACLSKEIYVSFAALLIFTILINNKYKKRWAGSLIYTLFIIVYFYWRTHILGGAFGNDIRLDSSKGYLNGLSIVPFLTDMALFAKHSIGNGYVPLSVLWLCTLVFSIKLEKKVLYFLFPVILTIVPPLIGVAKGFGIYSSHRYTLVLWLFFCFVPIFLLSRIEWRNLRNGKNIIGAALASLTLLVLSYGLVSNLMKDREWHKNIEHEFSSHQKFLLESHDIRDGLVPSPMLMDTFWYITGLCETKERMMGASCPTIILPNITKSKDIDRVFHYDPEVRAIKDISSLKDEVLSSSARIDHSAPLYLKIKWDNDKINWIFGPYDEGRYLLASDQFGYLDFPRVGSLSVEKKDYDFFLYYEFPNKKITSSSKLTLPANGELEWRRD